MTESLFWFRGRWLTLAQLVAERAADTKASAS